MKITLAIKKYESKVTIDETVRADDKRAMVLIDETIKILHYENKKFLENRERNKKIITGLITKEIDDKKLIELYDSQGITPEELKTEDNEKHEFVHG